MALSLGNLKKRVSEKPPLIAIYGPGGVGKTTLAAEFPDPVFIQTEDGGGDLELVTFADGPLKSYGEIMEAMQVLATEEHGFKTVVVDSITRMEPIVWAEVCVRNGWKSIEDPGYGKGYIEADAVWRDILDALAYLRDKIGMTVIMIGHEAVEQVNDPTTESYSRYTMRLHKRPEAMVREFVDVLGFMNQVTAIRKEKGGFGKETAKAIGGGQIALNIAPRPPFHAKCRFDAPPMLTIEKGRGYAALAPFLPGHRKPNTAAAA